VEDLAVKYPAVSNQLCSNRDNETERESNRNLFYLTGSPSPFLRFIPSRQWLWRMGNLLPLLRVMPIDNCRPLFVAQITQLL
jgi:hypothetical protein